MGSFPMLIVALALALAGGGPAAAPGKPVADTAKLTFVSGHSLLPDTAGGLDAIDALPRVYGQRGEAEFTAGQRTVWYSCPGAPPMSGGSRLTYTFEAGHRYELVCQEGRDAVIRQSDEC